MTKEDELSIDFSKITGFFKKKKKQIKKQEQKEKEKIEDVEEKLEQEKEKQDRVVIHSAWVYGE